MSERESRQRLKAAPTRLPAGVAERGVEPLDRTLVEIEPGEPAQGDAPVLAEQTVE